MKTYDVIIAGAGLAGLALAKELSGSGVSVLVLDKKSRATDAPYHSSGTFMNPAEYSIPLNFFHPINEIEFDSKNESCLKKVENCHVLDRVKYYQWLEKEALASDNVRIRYGCRVLGAEYKGGKIRDLLCDDKGRNIRLHASIYIDCTGLSAALGAKAGLTPKKCVMALGVEHLVPTKSAPNRACFYVGGNLWGGYGWVFPKQGNISIAGAGVIRRERYSSIDAIYEEMWEKRGLSVICRHRSLGKKFATLRTGRPLNKFVSGNLMIVGDSALQANPLIGEGIRFVLDAVKEAAGCIRSAISSGNIGIIKKYGTTWKSRYLKSFRFSYWMQKMLREVTLNDWILDKGVKVLTSAMTTSSAG